MNYFIDTEFDQNDLGREVQLISLAIVAENGAEFYAINSDYDQGSADPWLKKHVIPNLWAVNADMGPYDVSFGGIFCDRPTMRGHVEEFLASDDAPTFWGYYADYDWYLFTRLWGFMSMPSHFPMLCMDIKQLAKHLGSTDKPDGFQLEHNALVDARWNRHYFEYLTKATP